MALLLEEIVVELVAIAATLAAIACLAYLLVLCALERRDSRRESASRVREWAARRRPARRGRYVEPVTSRTPTADPHR
jgi:peptidoglycan/LPS O-acetylase OafA/YrhL